MKTRLAVFAFAALVPWYLAATSPAPEATIYEARRIITMDADRPSARFVAISGANIIAVGSSLAELQPQIAVYGAVVTGPVDRRFAGDILMPGLIDPHIHPMQAAVMLNLPFVAPDDWDLPGHRYRGARTPAAYRSLLKAEIARSTEKLTIVWGHHDLFHGPIDRAALDAMSPVRPLVIWQRSFHDVIANSAALKLLGLEDPATVAGLMAQAKADPSHLDLARGVFSETALPVALGKLQPYLLTPERIRQGMASLQRIMRDKGVTTVSDMGTGIFADFDNEAGLIKAAFERPDTASRVMLMPIASRMPDDAAGWLAARQARYAGNHVLLNRRVKMFADGAFFAQNMQMNPPGYRDGHDGKWLTEPKLLTAQFDRFWKQGFSLHVHVNGDKGLDVVLAGLEPLPGQAGQTTTLEHLGYSTERQNARIAAKQLMVSAQPNYIRVLGDAYAAHGLGPERARKINRLGSLERKAVPIGLHSDFNMAPTDPFYLAWVATSRITLSGKVRGPTERLSVDKAMRAITIDAARVIGLDAMTGSISIGKRADFAVLDRDPYAGGAPGLRTVQVKGVIFEGRFVAAGN
jgi:predicted amidohydrolase YtcJ